MRIAKLLDQVGRENSSSDFVMGYMSTHDRSGQTSALDAHMSRARVFLAGAAGLTPNICPWS